MRYARARAEYETETLSFRLYTADALKDISDNTSVICGPMGVIEGNKMTCRWVDIIRPQEKKDEEPPKTGDEIAVDIMRRAGLHQKAVS